MIAPPPRLSRRDGGTLAPMSGDAPARDEILEAPAPPLVLCPLAFEQRALLRYAKLPSIVTGPGPEAIRRAFAQRDRWPVPSPRLVILAGVAGGLRAGLPRGGAHLVSAVSGASEPPSIATAAGRAPITVVEATAPVHTPAEKARLRDESGADLVDTESRAFADCARAARLPWAIVRGVADAADDAVPPEVRALVGADGRSRPWRAAAIVLRRPTLLPELVRLARGARAAMRDAAFLADGLGALPALALCSRERPFLLYGGSFDPPHARHATMLLEAMRALGAPCATVMPAAINPLKRDAPPAPPEDRLALCRAAFAVPSTAAGGEIRLSRLEIDRPGPSYTIDTVERLLSRHPHLAGAIRFLVGSDAIRGIERWHRWRDLVALATPAVVVRPPDDHASTRAFLGDLAARTGVRDACGWLLGIAPVERSSTEVRAAIARGERPDGLQDRVWTEIEARGLYGFGNGG